MDKLLVRGTNALPMADHAAGGRGLGNGMLAAGLSAPSAEQEL